MRFFQKAFTRAKLPLEYSKGFNPHPIISFAAPLSVGLTSDGEYMDIDLTEDIDIPTSIKDINDNMCEGVRIISIRKIEEKEKNAMSLLAAADYEITINSPSIDINSWSKFYNDNAQIMVNKKTKKSEILIDIKPLILSQSMDANKSKLQLMLCQGSEKNLSPQLLMQAFFDFNDAQMKASDVSIHRQDMYKKSADNEYVSL